LRILRRCAIGAVFFIQASCHDPSFLQTPHGEAALLSAANCSDAFNLNRAASNRTYATSFESVNDFNGFYIVPQNYHGACSHGLATGTVHTGTYSHRGWIYDSYDPSTPFVNNNHRGYPTIQFHKTPGGSFVTPCLITFWVWLDVALAPAIPENEWFSLATLTDDASDVWSNSICINVSHDGFVHLMHVPWTGQKVHTVQTTSITFPMRQWVKIEIYADFRSSQGYLKVRQDGVLVSQANVYCRKKTLAQAHFGLYAPPSLSAGEVYNDDLTVQEVDADPWP
jgi:hypothetical protein